MGIDPFTSMTTGISSLLNIPLGVFQGSVNAILFLILILLSRSNLKYLNIFRLCPCVLHAIVCVPYQ